MILVHQPIESAYVSGGTALATLDELGLLDAVKTVGVEQDTTTVEAVKSGLADGSMTYAGGADDLQYRELVKSKCDFAVLPADILSGDEMADTDVKSKLSDAADSFATLDVPMLVDRSADEETELGKREWIKVYGALFGCTEQTDSLFQKAVDAAKKNLQWKEKTWQDRVTALSDFRYRKGAAMKRKQMYKRIAAVFVSGGDADGKA